MKKQVDIVMLPTEKASKLYYNNNDKCLQLCEISKQNTVLKQNQHLYFLSDDKIKDSEWFLCTYSNTIHNKLTGFEKECCKKIIATTDESLVFKDNISIFQRKGLTNIYPTEKPLPRPSNEFLKKFCELGGVDKVLVEYDIYQNPDNGNPNFGGYDVPDKLTLKVAPDNTITIYPI